MRSGNTTTAAKTAARPGAGRSGRGTSQRCGAAAALHEFDSPALRSSPPPLALIFQGLAGLRRDGVTQHHGQYACK